VKNRSKLGENRVDDKWTCEVCGKVINGKRNTLHLGVISHINAEWRQGKRDKPYNPYGRKLERSYTTNKG